MKKTNFHKLITPLAEKLIEQEKDSQALATKIRKEINEHSEYMKERRKSFDLIRNK